VTLRPVRLVIVLFVSSFALSAQEALIAARTKEPRKAAWEWSDDQRIAARLEPQAIQERFEAHHAQLTRVPGGGGRLESQAVMGAEAEFIIDGSRNPELFLPFELLTHLLYGVDDRNSQSDRERFRARYATAIREQVGVPALSFWADMDIIARPYLQSLEESARLAEAVKTAAPPERRALQAQLDEAPKRSCRLRAAALTAARRRFGREGFDRFLYSAVAPSLHVASRRPSAEEAAGLRMLAGGCQ